MATIQENDEFNSSLASKELYRAIKGLGTNKDILIQVLTKHTNKQRQLIKEKYQFMYGVDLKKHINGEQTVIGNFKRGLLALLNIPHENDAKLIHDVLKPKKSLLSLTKNKSIESILIEIMITRTKDELDLIRDYYYKKFKSELDKDIRDCHFLTEPIKDLLRSLLNNKQEKNFKLEDVKASQIAQKLIDFESNIFCLENELIKLCNCKSKDQLIAILNEYFRLKSVSLCEQIDKNKELDADFKKAVLTLIEYRVDSSSYFANTLYSCIQNGLKDDSLLLRIILARCENDLKLIKEKYLQIFNTTLLDHICKKTSGNYLKLLGAIIKY